jgi:hypothetical protein
MRGESKAGGFLTSPRKRGEVGAKRRVRGVVDVKFPLIRLALERSPPSPRKRGEGNPAMTTVRFAPRYAA